MANIRPIDLDGDEEYAESDYSDQELEQIIDDTLERVEEDDEDIAKMSDVEIRFEEASYLRALLQNPLFDNADSPIAKRVEKKVRGLIQQELKTLMGFFEKSGPAKHQEPVQVKSVFSPDEEKVLKALASKILNKEKATDTPVVNTTSAPAPVSPVVNAASVRPKKYKKVEKEQKKANKKEVKVVEKELMIDGKMKKFKIKDERQTQPPPEIRGYPTMSAEATAAHYSGLALTTMPSEGIMGVALGVAHPQLLNQTVISTDEDGD
jgi:hypothetical protein